MFAWFSNWPCVLQTKISYLSSINIIFLSDKPYIPGSLVVMSISHNSIDLKFNVSVPPADGYLIEHWTEGVNITNIALKPPTLPETHLNVNLGDLEPSRNYTVRVSPYVEDGPFFGIPSIQIFRTKPIPSKISCLSPTLI